MIAWSRILDDEEALCVVNPHPTEARGGDVVVDATLNRAPRRMRVLLRTDGSRALETDLVVGTRDGTAFVEIRDLAPAGVLVASSHEA